MATVSGISVAAKPTFQEYRQWLASEHKAVVDQRLENYYEIVCRTAKDAFNVDPIIQSIREGLRELDDVYLIENKCGLMSNFDVKLVTKPFVSFLEKTYRKNVLFNPSFPNPPDGDWLLPDNWYGRINDVIRTTLVVKYLDGAEYLLAWIQKICMREGVNATCDYEARFEGYYAIHLYFKRNIEITTQDFSKRQQEFQLEIQLTTQIKEIVKSILHSFYEKARVATGRGAVGKDWRWDYKSDEFVANNLGHVIHCVEGMIVQIRERQGGDFP